MPQLFIPLLALKLPHQIPTLTLKLLYHYFDSELTIYGKTRLQKKSPTFTDSPLLDPWVMVGVVSGQGKDGIWGSDTDTWTPSHRVTWGFKTNCLLPWVFCAMMSQNNTTKKGVSEIWGPCPSSSLHEELAGQSCTNHLHSFGLFPHL